MKTFFKKIATALLVLLSAYGIAQPTGGNLGQLELSVTDKYKARVAEAEKISGFPDFKDTTTKKLPVSYRINSIPLSVSYTPKPLPPARIAKVPVESLKQAFVRLGVGFYGTPLAEGYWNSGRSSKEAYGLWAKHLSTQRGVRDIVYENNSFSHNQLGAYYNRFYRKLKWQTDLVGVANKQSLYGLPSLPNAETTALTDTKAPAVWRRNIRLNTSLENTTKKQEIFEQSRLHYGFFNDSYGNFEHNVSNSNRFTLPTDGVPLQLDLGLEYTQTTYDSLLIDPFERSSFIVQARPHIEMTLKNVRFDFGLNLFTNTVNTAQPDTSFTDFYFFPELHLSYPLVKDVLSVYAGFKGRLINNTYQSLSNENPFLGPVAELRPTFERDIFIGLKGLLSATSSFHVKGGLMNIDDQLLYFRSPPFNRLDSVLPALYPIYDDAEVFYVRGELGWHYQNNLQFDLYGELRAYNMNVQKLAWHIPAFTAGLQTHYTLKEKIQLGANMRYIGPREAFAQELNPERESTLPGFVDVNASIEYLYNTRLSAFVHAYNLLSTANTTYLGYDMQRINLLFGIGYRF